MLEDIATDFFEKDLRSFQSKTKIHIAEDELEEMLVTAWERHIERGGEKEEKRRKLLIVSGMSDMSIPSQS